MIAAITTWSTQNRLLVAFMAIVLAAVGVRGYLTLPVDAVPDVTNVQVQVLTNAPGLSPLEMEQLVARPIELSMAGLPGTSVVRSISRAGVCAVTIVFEDSVDLGTARELVNQRLPQARESISAAAKRPEMGPLSTGLGEVFHFTVTWPGHNARDVRTLLDWDIAYSLKTVPGVVEVNAWGGELREIEVRLRPDDMRALGVSFDDVEHALRTGGGSSGGGALSRGDEQVLVRLDGQYRSLSDVASQIVATKSGGAPITVHDVATVRDGSAFRQSIATADGKGETVYAMVQMVAGGNAHDVIVDVKTRMIEIEARLPEGAKIQPFYDRAALVDRVLGTVRRSLLEGGVIVAVVLLVLLGDAAAGLVVATAIPLSMLGAFALMKATGQTGNLMSLGAIDFGLVVDGAVVIVEGALATMAARRMAASDAINHECKAVGRPVAFGVLIIAIVYVPVLMLEGVEGKMFRPMAITVLFAIGTSLVLTFTWIPALASLVLRKVHAQEPVVVRALRRAYEPLLDRMLGRPLTALALSIALVAVGVAAAMTRGAEFTPRLEEGDLVVQLARPPSVSLEEATRGTGELERALVAFPEVRRVVSRTGSPDVATDIMGIEQSDVFVILAPRAEWPHATTTEQLVAKLDAAASKALPGTALGWTQPIEMRANELLGGVRSDVGIKVFGDDFVQLAKLVEEIKRTLAKMDGAVDIRSEALTGLTQVTVRPDPARMGRLDVKTEDVAALTESLRTGRKEGLFADRERRFDVVLKLDVPPTPDEPSLSLAPLLLAHGRVVPLGDVAKITVNDGPALIGREHARRRVQVEANVRGRDLASFVQELNAKVDAIPKPPGYYVELAGQYEHLVSASRRLAIVVPITLALIFAMLYFTFHDLRSAALIFSNVPVAASGGVLALAARGLPLSISAAVGMIALFGVATLNGVVLLSAVQAQLLSGVKLDDAVRIGARERLRPVVTTAVVAALGFLPMALATGTGAEVQRPLATVVMGGLVTSTLLTLLILPPLTVLITRKR